MDENFTKFNSKILADIENFVNSQSDLLYIAGFRGSGKSGITERYTKNLDDDILLFRHMCFENSVIDDFLLGFYDTLRFYSINKKINLKKSLTDNFAQKVSFYFKNLNKKCLIIIDNFEIISQNSEIMDFLAHLATYENVKVILISRVLNPEFFEEKGLGVQIIDIHPYDYETFKLKVEDALEIYEEDDIRELYEHTKGYELYLSMALRYIVTVNTSLKEFIEEFKKRGLEFEDFLLSKIVSLVPPIYLPFLQNMACLNHSVKIDFIEFYRLGDVSLVNYLYRKMLISKFDDEIYLKDYLKQYFLSNLSVKEKIDNYKNLIKIYEQELAKSPRDRLLRLSRESIRKQIDFIKTKIPNVNTPNDGTISSWGQGFSYINRAGSTPTPWYRKIALEKGKQLRQEKQAETPTPKGKDELLGEEILSMEERALINEFRKKKALTESVSANGFKEIMAKCQKLEENYDYKGVLELLNEALSKDFSQDEKLEIYLKTAENKGKLNDFEGALENYKLAANISKDKNDNARYAETMLLKANLYKNLYRFQNAKECLREVINFGKEGRQNTVSKGFLSLGEILEMENDFEGALENYKLALGNYHENQGARTILAEIYFKIALLYDDGQNRQSALEYYQKSIENAKNIDGTRDYLSTSYANMGLIYSEMWAESGSEEDFEHAVSGFKNALKTDENSIKPGTEPNYNGIYFASRQLAGILKHNSPEEAFKYLNIALEASKNLHDNFKMALSYLETGDYYYNNRNNASALESYLEAKKALGSGISAENLERITVRINDMRVKMGEEEFSEVLKRYE